MSATSLKIQDRESIYERILRNFLHESNKYLLHRNFMLGKGMDEDKAVFNLQYLRMLCNYNCDTNYYFENKLKNILSVGCKSKIRWNTDTPLLNDEYENLCIECNSGQYLEFIFSKINQGRTAEWKSCSC